MAQPKKRPFVSLKGMETGRITSAGKPVYKYKGEEISEKSIDIEADGKTYVIPTVIDGKLYTEEAAVAKFFNKEVEPIKVLKENIKERSKKLSKGGDMNKQMELFEEGGLKDEGGMTDEVSGNDVPSGSTREEVRDDIPAQLSEGEFVLPADVVRFHGLEKLMMLRQEAKQGLQKMEAMGQMGNSEEATLPDDIPFSLEDLDMEDEDEPQEMADGGYVLVEGKPMPIPMIGGQLPPITTRPMPETKNMAVGGFTNPTGTYQVPTNIATQPSYFQNYQQSTAPFRPFVQQNTGNQPPNAPPVAGQVPTFGELMPQLTGKRETIEYRNDAGQKLFIPFINGKPIYPIPEGYTRYTAETEVTPEKQPTVQTTTVRQDQPDGGDDNVLSGTSQVRGLDNSIVSTDFANQTPDKVAQNMANMSLADRGLAVANAIEQSKGYTGVARGMQQLGAAVVPGVLAGKMYGQKTMNPMDVLGKIGQPDMAAKDAITGAFGYDVKGFMDLSGLIDDPLAEERAEKNAIAQAMGFKDLSAMTSYYGIEPTHVKGYNPGQTDPTHGGVYSANGQTTDANGNVSYSSMADFGRAMTASSKSGYYGGEKQAKEDARNGNPNAKDFLNNLEIETLTSKESFTGSKDDTFGYDESQGTSTGDTATDTSISDVGSEEDPGPSDTSVDDVGGDNDEGESPDADDDPGFNQGGLAGKKKKKLKVKKMKRGGLASR
jgi:hypothetical protein